MKELLQSRGFELYGYWIPTFTLKEGELLSVWFPGDSKENEGVCSKIEKTLVALFMGKQRHSSLLVKKPFANVEEFSGDNWIRQRFYPSTPQRYLWEKSKLGKLERQQLLKTLNSKPNIPLIRVGGNSRRMLALWASLSKSKQVLFKVGGLDRQGVARVYQEIERVVTQGGAAIELNYPYVTGGNPPKYTGRHQPEKAKIIEIKQKINNS